MIITISILIIFVVLKIRYSTKRTKMLGEWFKFTSDVLQYAHEATDPKIRKEIIEWHIINCGALSRYDYEYASKNLLRLKEHFSYNFAKYIPSLKSKMVQIDRDSKLQSLFDDKRK